MVGRFGCSFHKGVAGLFVVDFEENRRASEQVGESVQCDKNSPMLRLEARWAEASSSAVNLPRRQSASVGDHAPKPSLEASVSMMNRGDGSQWNARGTEGLVLSTEIHQEIS